MSNVGIPMDLHTLEEELKKLGITIVSSRQDTIVSIRIKGLAGKALDRGLRLCDQLLHEKLKNVVKVCTDSSTKLFVDPTFGPTAEDPQGASALCKTGATIPSKGGSQHQMKVLGLLKVDKLRWERPEYAADDDEDSGADNQDEDEEEETSRSMPQERVFASNAKLFSDGVSSGDVIQGNLGDCWFLSALSVVATRSDLLEQTFWRGDKSKSKGLFVCKFMKNFVWNYVIIDDRLPVYGFNKSKEGKPYFARCRDANELWVSLLEKAYAKLHGSYEALIGGFVDVALNDLTGMCSEQVIMKPGYPGFGEDPFAPTKPQQQKGDPFWDKISRYKASGTLMGCSIQPAPSSADKSVAAESSAGNGLYFKHAYSLVDCADVKTTTKEQIKLVKLRNPWGMGEWTGPWSDASEERIQNQDVIEQFFKILKRKVGGNLSKRVFLRLNGKGELKLDEISQEEVIDMNTNDGTFFMSYDAWMQYFTHFFAGIDFPDEWHGRRVEGCWNDANCGGNTTKSTWINNPRFELVVEEKSQFFISLSQEDPRGKENLKIVPIGFHICSLSPVALQDKAVSPSSKWEIKEPPGKADVYYRLYKEKDRVEFQKGVRAEPLPPLIIPGSAVSGVDEDGVVQPAYTFKQAVSVDVTLQPGKYCILPSMYMRTDKDSGKTNVGSFWLSIYSNKPKFSLQGGEKIAEEEEGEDENDGNNNSNSPVGSKPGDDPRRRSTRLPSSFPAIDSPGKKSDASVSSLETISVCDRRRRFEDAKEELLAQAKSKGIGLRQLKMEFAKAGVIKKMDVRKKMLSIGFKADELSDDKINVIFNGLDDTSQGSIQAQSILNLFEAEIHEDQMACEIPEVEDDDVPEKLHDEGILSLELRGARDLPVVRRTTTSDGQRTVVRLPVVEFTTSEAHVRQLCALQVCAKNPSLAQVIRPVLKRNGWLPAASLTTDKKKNATTTLRQPLAVPNPVEMFYELLENEMKTRIEDVAERKASIDLDPRAGNSLDSMQSMAASFTNNSAGTATLKSSTSVSVSASAMIHKSNKMQSLEEKRCRRLAELQKKKREALGDKCKAACLPRLIGGVKSGSSFAQCSDCGSRVPIAGRAGGGVADTTPAKSSDVAPLPPPSYLCTGSQCFNSLCLACYLSLPVGKKVCEDCFEHELAPREVFGSQLRALLIEKIGYSDDHKAKVLAYFKSVDKDQSGALNYDEFATALVSLELQPPLSEDQVKSLMVQFDVNKDGEISLSEFHGWVFEDQVWTPGQFASSETKLSATPDVMSSLIAPIIDSLIQAVMDAHAVSASTTQWITTSNSVAVQHALQTKVLPDIQYKESTERGSILFQRVQILKMAGNAATEEGGTCGTTEGDSIDQIFDMYDTDRSGKIDATEFRGLLAALGLQLSEGDAKLLMRRVESSASMNEVVDLTEFRAYVASLTRDGQANASGAIAPSSSLSHTLLQLSEIAAKDATSRESLQEIVQQFHWNMRRSHAWQLRNLLRKQCHVSVSIEQIQRVSNALHFREVVPMSSAPRSANGQAQPAAPVPDQDKLLEMNNSGDVLNALLCAGSTSLSSQLKAFSPQTVCAQIGGHLEDVTKTTSAEGVWRTLFGGSASITDSVDQRTFLDKLLASGFLISFDAISTASTSTAATSNGPVPILQRLMTKLFVALALDALRGEAGLDKANDEASWSLSFNLFIVVLRHSTIDAIETKFTHVLKSYVRFCRGTTYYLVSIAITEDSNLIVRATEPTHKYSMDFVLTPHEYTRMVVSQLSDAVWPRAKINSKGGRNAAFTASPNGLITELTHPRLHHAMLTLLSRLRICIHDPISSQHTMTPYLTLVEDDSFVVTLETLLARAKLPFFWQVSPTTLEFSIDGDYLTQMKPVRSFHQLISESLHQKPAAKPLVSLLKFTGSSLRVKYEIIGQNATFDSSWWDFQALLSGHQNTFAVLEFQPQGDRFVTKVDCTGGNGAPKWNFQQLVALKEPEITNHRLDRPVVYTDTVRVSSIPDGSSSKKITFSSVATASQPKKSSKTVGGHFVVLSVRRALPEKHGDKPRLYCTAYDPFTSSDFAVEGTPPQWEPDFFNAALHPDCEAQWLTLVEQNLFLGMALTPKVVIKVFTKHSKVDKLVGECEVSVSSAVAHEGHVFDDWFPLLHPSEPSVTTGAVNVAFHFNAKKVSEIVQSATNGKVVVAAAAAASGHKEKESEPRSPGIATPPSERSDTGRLKEMEKALNESELAKRDALEQARRLKVQLMQQQTNVQQEDAASVVHGEVARWKSKLEHVRREQEAQLGDHEKRVAALQAELRRLEQEREESPSPSPAPASVVAPTNLKQAGLGEDASAHDLLSAMNDILVHRSPERPYNGLKKAMAAVADVPGKVSLAAFEDVLDDFGLALPTAKHKKSLFNILDHAGKGRVTIEDFFIKLCGDADLNPSIPVVATKPIQPPTLPASPPRPATATNNSGSTLPAPTRPSKMSWKEMKKLLLLNLPDGWETRYTEKGRPYFCNHANRSTQWKHPVTEVEVKYSEWIKENGANFQRMAHTMPTTARK